MKLSKEYLERLKTRFHSKYNVNTDGCWIWTDCYHESGYGLIMGTPVGTIWDMTHKKSRQVEL